MRILYNHGLTIEELYTNTPKKIIDRKWAWFIANGGSKNSYEDVISDPFKFAINLVINKVIDDKLRFKIPIIGEAYIDFEIVTEDNFEAHRQCGRFQEIDFISSEFTGYAIRYYFKGKAYQKSFQLHLGGDLKKKFLEKINDGEKFYSIKDFKITDILDEVYKKFPHLKKSEVKNLVLHGFRRMHSGIRAGCGITITTNKYANCYFFIGAIYSDPHKQIKDYVVKRDKKLRRLFKWSETPHNPYYYIGINENVFKNWVEDNKKARTTVTFKNVIARKIMEEIFARHRNIYIFRLKAPRIRGWTYRIDQIMSRDVVYMGRTHDWKFTPSTLTWKELIKLYEAGSS